MKKIKLETSRYNLSRLTPFLILIILFVFSESCNKDETENIEEADFSISGEPFINPKHNIEQATSDEAQRNTIAFDAIGFMTGNLGAQTFLPPGKVADYNGFQYFRDNDQTSLGHNTNFVTIIANNILTILTDEQVQLFINAANGQIDQINEYGYKRFVLCKAFRRLLESDIPDGTTRLNLQAIKDYSAELYLLDGEISYGRAKLFGEVVNSLSTDQKEQIKTLYDLEGIGNWPAELSNQLDEFELDKDINVAVMTYASEIYTWYAGSVTGDTYFCPERQGTYFGSFYLKDWPAMGNPDYTIDDQLTASAGQNFFNILTSDQYNKIETVVNDQKSALLSIVETRETIAKELREFLEGNVPDESSVLSLSETYGEYDGEIIYLYATSFTEIYHSLDESQKSQLNNLANDLGYVDPSGAFLYSESIPMPEIANTDFFFK